MSDELHARLIERQSDDELERKANKAWMRKGKLWTQEEIDAADRAARKWVALFDSITDVVPEAQKSL